MHIVAITVMYHIVPPWQTGSSISQEASIVFIGKVVGIDCGFSLTGNFQCITIISGLQSIII